MYCVIKCVVRGNQARVKNADLHSCNVKTQICVTGPQCVNFSNNNHLPSVTSSSIHLIALEGLSSYLIFKCLHTKLSQFISQLSQFISLKAQQTLNYEQQYVMVAGPSGRAV